MIEVIIEKEKFEALYDSGSNVSLINQNVINHLKLQTTPKSCFIRTISGKSFSGGTIEMPVRIGELQEEMKFYIVEDNNFKYQVLLGLDAIEKFRLIQDETLKVLQKPSEVLPNFSVNTLETENLSKQNKTYLKNLIDAHMSSFAMHKYDVGKVHDMEAEIKLLSNRYISQAPYRSSASDHQEMENQLKRLLETGLIEYSCSPYAAPVTMAWKKEDNARTRLCIDYRGLNQIAVPDCYPFPRIEDIIEKTIDAEFFSILDINSAFWSIPIKKEDRQKLAFVTKDDHYQWTVLPFGYRNSPLIFQRALATTLRRNNLSHSCINYMDDIIVFSKSFEEHMKTLESLISAMKNEGFKLKLSKCKFAQKSVNYLGHVISKKYGSTIFRWINSYQKFSSAKESQASEAILG